MVYYNPLDIACKSITGAISDKDKLKIKIKLSDAERCRLILKRDEDGSYKAFEMEKDFDMSFSCVLPELKKGLYWYYFVFDNEFCIGLGENYRAVASQNPSYYQLLVYSEGYETPDWFKGGVMYQIFPDRFYREGDFSVPAGKIKREDWGGIPTYKPNAKGKVLNNDFFGGNLKGIEKKLDYIKSLGVNVIYLNPIFQSFSNHRYDTSDYMKIDEVLGTEQDLKSLIEKAKKLDIKIIFDGVFNHTGDDSVYFNKYGRFDTVGAYQSKDSPYYDWFCFDNFPDTYKSWWGIDVLPTINKDSMEFEDFIAGENGMLEHYAKLGIGGVRLDDVDELPDSFVVKIRNAIRKVNKDNLLIGEVWEDATNKIAYGVRRKYFQGAELDSVMNYPLKNAIINYVMWCDSYEIANTVRSQLDNYPKQALDCLMNILGTHDTPRILSILGSDRVPTTKEASEHFRLNICEIRRGIEKLKIASTLQYTLYGVPSVYYGDEVGLEGNMDPFNRKCYPWGKENQELLAWYDKLGKIRKHPLFKDGRVNILAQEKGLFIFERTNGEENIVVAVNMGRDKYFVKTDRVVYDLLSGKRYDGKVSLSRNKIVVLYDEKL